MSTPRWKIVRHPGDGHIVHIEYIGQGMFTWAGEIQNIANLAEAEGIAQERERVRKLIEQERAVSFPGGHWHWPFFDRLFAALDAEPGGKEHKRVAALCAAEQRVIETSRTLWGSMWAAKVQLPPECVLEWDQFSAANRDLLALRHPPAQTDATGGTR